MDGSLNRVISRAPVELIIYIPYLRENVQDEIKLCRCKQPCIGLFVH